MLNRLPALTHLTLVNSGLSDGGLRAIIHWPGLRQLQWLDLSGTQITDQSVLDLVDSPHFLAHTHLNLRNTPTNERVQQALKIRFGDRIKV